MRELALNDRPREKLLAHGAAALGDNELVALVLGSGRRHLGRPGRGQRTAGGARRRARAVAIERRRSGAGAGHRSGKGRAAAGGGRTGPADADARAAHARAAADAARHGGVLDAGVRGPAGRTVRHRAARHEVPRAEDDGAGDRHAEYDGGRSRATCFGKRRSASAAADRRLPQSSLRRSQPEPRRCGADAAAGGGGRADGNRSGGPRHPGRRAHAAASRRWDGCEPRCCISTASPASRATWCSARCSTPACRSTS